MATAVDTARGTSSLRFVTIEPRDAEFKLATAVGSLRPADSGYRAPDTRSQQVIAVLGLFADSFTRFP